MEYMDRRNKRERIIDKLFALNLTIILLPITIPLILILLIIDEFDTYETDLKWYEYFLK